MRRGSTLLLVVLIGALPGCGAGASRGDVAAAELEAWSARAEAMREHSRLVELETRLHEMERRSASYTRPCDGGPDAPSAGAVTAPDAPEAEPLRSEGDFLAEARVATPASAPPAAKLALAATPQAAAPASERARLEQRLEGLREYAFDPQSGLSAERRDALRVLLRRERQLDPMNPWGNR